MEWGRSVETSLLDDWCQYHIHGPAHGGSETERRGCLLCCRAHNPLTNKHTHSSTTKLQATSVWLGGSSPGD
ncbi:hypothetical protein JOB18_010299 [Solea senegalensis]|uniref:Uncharacterized protein n=1 Tax=Solea senegalensis TaxID=28829 RepID=A0AAV6R957_SOLSE|nr:hypothetical protein JOB18_010299 [Solea senegalensis]